MNLFRDLRASLTDLKEYKVGKYQVYSITTDGENTIIRWNRSLIVYPTTNTTWCSFNQSGRKYFFELKDYPEFQVKPRMKYTLENGVIHGEPWDAATASSRGKF